jgi:hypothetical protein
MARRDVPEEWRRAKRPARARGSGGESAGWRSGDRCAEAAPRAMAFRPAAVGVSAVVKRRFRRAKDSGFAFQDRS